MPREVNPWAALREFEFGRRIVEFGARMRTALRSIPRSRSYPVLGAILALGAPLGLFLVRALATGRTPRFALITADVGHLLVTYAYVTFGTLTAFAAFGYVLGRSFDRVRVLSITDPLTGVFNRRHFAQRLVEELGRGRRHGRPTSVLCVDIDRLKAINDASGHKAGDRALATVCRTLSKNARATDAVARLGGDEFAVLLPETSVAQASVLASRILADLRIRGSASMQPLAVSIGIAEQTVTEGVPSDDLLEAADAALYRAKAAGGGQAVVARGCDAQRAREPVARLEVDARCAACHGDQDVRSQDARGDTGFCGDCRDRARGPFAETELGGQG